MNTVHYYAYVHLPCLHVCGVPVVLTPCQTTVSRCCSQSVFPNFVEDPCIRLPFVSADNKDGRWRVRIAFRGGWPICLVLLFAPSVLHRGGLIGHVVLEPRSDW
jgi:hypothetical protein